MTTETQLAHQDVDVDGDVPAMADSLQSLLSEISTRVGLADQRYTDIIEEMRGKLTELDALAKASREKAEEQARLEAEAEAEAKRLAEAEAEAEAKAKAKAEAEAAAEAEAQAEAQAEAERLAEAKRCDEAEAKRQEELEAARKKSEADAAEAVETAKAAAAAVVAKSRPIYPDDIDPFDIIDHVPVRQREPWDRESADVFTRHFELFTRHDGDGLPADGPSSHGVGEMTETTAEVSGERIWLNGRFNDIASRIAEMMAAQPANLGARFESLEARIETAITTVSANAASGADTLKQIEGHISEIDEHVDFIRTELARLDGMEAQIRAVIEIQKGAPAKTSEASVSDEPAGMLQLTSLLQRLMSERRSTEEHTVSMLDTLQQAMIRVLDRIEAIESHRPAAHGAGPGDALDGFARTDAAVPSSILANQNRFMDFEEEFGGRDAAALDLTTGDPSSQDLPAALQQVRRNFVADAQRARDRANGQGRRTPVTDMNAPLPARSMVDRLLRSSGKQLAVAAVGLLLPLNALFLYLVLAASKPDAQIGMRSAAEQGMLTSDRLTDASRAEASEPLISQPPPSELLTRINAPLPPEPSPQPEPAASAPVGAKVEMPPAAIGPLTLRRAAADGDASAQFEVAARLAEGKGIDQDFKSAVEWYLRSASTGFAQAQYRLGTHYERGLGVDRDPERARVWYQRAAEQGNVKAMHNLAVINAGKPDYPGAIRWFTEASAYNLPDSQFNLAVLLEGGLGGTKDPKQAYVWFALAARGGDKEAMKRRDQVKAQLSADAIAAADDEVRSFRTKLQVPLINDARVAGEAWKKQAAAN